MLRCCVLTASDSPVNFIPLYNLYFATLCFASLLCVIQLCQSPRKGHSSRRARRRRYVPVDDESSTSEDEEREYYRKKKQRSKRKTSKAKESDSEEEERTPKEEVKYSKRKDTTPED